MKLLTVSSTYPPTLSGGAELVAHRHNIELGSLGVECAAFAGLSTRPDEHKNRLSRDEYEGIPVWRFHRNERQLSHDRENFLSAAADLCFGEVLGHFRPDIVHFHSLAGLSVNFVQLAREHGAKTVWTVHDHWAFCHRNTLTKPDGTVCQDTSACAGCLPAFISTDGRPRPIMERNREVRSAFTKVDLIISPSRYLAEMHASVGMAQGKAIRIVGYGTESRFHGIPQRREQGACVFGSLGALAEHKGTGLVLDALCQATSGENWRFVFAGFGPMRSNIRRFRDKHPAGGRVDDAGEIPPRETHRFLADIDVLVAPSLWPENQPLAILEAMAAGRPVISTRLGGIPELIEHEVTGLLLDKPNEQNLTRAMQRYAQNPELRSQHGKAARTAALNRQIRDAAHALKACYTELLDTASFDTR